MKKNLLAILLVAMAPAFSSAQCTTTNATSCHCKDSTQTDCDLLPDIELGHPPFSVYNDQFGIIEFSQTGNGVDNGRLKVTVSTPNVGHGPLELRTTNIFVCGTDTFVGTAPSICPDGITYPKILVNQRIYHKSGSTMTYYDRPAGTMTYHPSHGHMHVDNWGNYTLRTRDSLDPNPLHWPIVGSGTKLAFCVEDYGTCQGYPGHCLDSTGNALNNSSNFPNYGLGGGGYNCSPTVQGISSGYVDIYWTSLDGMWINLPPGICNGEYWIVCEVDPNQNFTEEREDNNVFAIPYIVNKQDPNPAAQSLRVAIANSALGLCQGEAVTLTADTTGLNGASFLWSNGDTTSSTNVSTGGVYTVDVSNHCGTGTSVAVPVNVYNPPVAPVTVNDTIPTPGTATLSATASHAVNWYDQPTGGTLLGTGNLFTTPFINSTTTFYAETTEPHVGASSLVGAADTTIGIGGTYSGNQSLIFDCYNPFILHNVTVYAQTAGTRTVQLMNATNTVLQQTVINVNVGMNVVTLDFNITPGTGYQLTRTGGELYRNNPTTNVGYPFTVNNFCSITGSTQGVGYYYFFYNWVIKLPDNACTSARNPALAVVSQPSLIADVNVLKSLYVYPNPANTDVTVSFYIPGVNKTNVTLIDAIGHRVFSKELSSANGNFQENINLGGLAKGVYSIHILGDDKNYYHKLVIR